VTDSPLWRSLRRSAPAVGASIGFSLALNVLVLAAPIYMLQVYDRVLTSRSIETLVMLTAITLLALVALSWLDALRMQLLARAGARIEADNVSPILRKLFAVPDGPSEAEPPYRSGLRDLRTVRQFLSGQGLIALADAPWTPVFVLAIAMFHPLLGWMALGGVLLLLVLAWLDDRLSRGRIAAAGQATALVGDMAQEGMANADVVRAMGLSPVIADRVSQAVGRANLASLGAAHGSSRILALSKFSRQALQSVMLGTGAYLVMKQEASPGAMIAATIVLGRAMAPIEAIVGHGRSLIQARQAWSRLSQFLADADAPLPMPLPAPVGVVVVDKLIYAVTRSTPLLKGLSFGLAPGELLGVIGPSGAGKTLLGRLLVGNLRATSGSVRLDAAELVQWPQESLGRHLGYLPQDVQLFEGSVAENIARLGDPRAHAEAIVRAARLAGVHELILQLPQGYETPVGPRGSHLSGGQRQLVGLARAVFGDPRLIVLDEPNASLDSEGENKLLGLLAALKQLGSTVVFITHRPTLLRAADKILVLHQGQQAAFGAVEDVLGRFTRATPAGSEAGLQGMSAAGGRARSAST
jgi:PrtD family type I secretion system ABC transporter